MAQPTSLWEKTKSGGRTGFGKLYSFVDRLGPPQTGKPSNRVECEVFWPTTLDREADKAARILKSFCRDGFSDDDQIASPDGPRQKNKPMKKIPHDIIRNAQGLIIFATLRSGLWLSGSGGSGILVGRKADGSWSSPSAIQLHTMGLAFQVGTDMYDCILTINTQKALEAFTRSRTTIGDGAAITAGPYTIGDAAVSGMYMPETSMLVYLKSRGMSAEVQIEGTVVVERMDENERFYGERVRAQEILKGKARHPPLECRGLYETLKAAEGDETFDASLLPTVASPSDFEIIDDGRVFGVPDRDDPDPYGVLQLEKEGMVIREAGSRRLASWEQFTFSPAITSPVYESFERRSNRDSGSQILSRRASYMGSINTQVANEVRSSRDTPRTPVSMVDMSTQTDDLPPPPTSPGRLSFRSASAMGNSRRTSLNHIPENLVAPSNSSIRSRTPSWRNRRTSHSPASRSITPPSSAPPTKPSLSDDDRDLTHRSDTNQPDQDAHKDESDQDDNLSILSDDDDDLSEEEAVIIEAPVLQPVASARAPTKVIQKARMIELPKRGPPPVLPARNPNRRSGPITINADRPSSRASNLSPPTTPNAGIGLGLEVGGTPQSTTPSELKLTHDSALQSPALTPEVKPVAPQIEDATEKERQDKEDLATPAETPDELPTPDPWSGVLAQHSSVNASKTSLEVPGAFVSAPTTPAEELGENKAVLT